MRKRRLAFCKHMLEAGSSGHCYSFSWAFSVTVSEEKCQTFSSEFWSQILPILRECFWNNGVKLCTLDWLRMKFVTIKKLYRKLEYKSRGQKCPVTENVRTEMSRFISIVSFAHSLFNILDTARGIGKACVLEKGVYFRHRQTELVSF